MSNITQNKCAIVYLRAYAIKDNPNRYLLRLKELEELLGSHKYNIMGIFIEHVSDEYPYRRVELREVIEYAFQLPLDAIIICDLCVSDIEALNYYSVISDITNLPVHLNIENSTWLNIHNSTKEIL